jgi:hypothetical protein
MTDNYASETTWDLQDGAGNVIETGDPDDNATLHTWEFELDAGDYTWTIYDSFGDGICCAYGDGYYNIYVGGDLIATGGEFDAYEESVSFDIGSSRSGLLGFNIYRAEDEGDFALFGVADTTHYLDETVVEESEYHYHVTADYDAGESVPSNTVTVYIPLGVDGTELIPDVFALHQNFPNPFNPLTALPYDVPEIADVKIDIYNLLGQNIRTLVTGEHEPGFYRATWNGKNDRGTLVTTGVYIYQITARSNATGEVAFTKTRKLVLMK